MAILPASSGESASRSPSIDSVPSKSSLSPSNKRSASVSLSDSETLVTTTSKTPLATTSGMKTNATILDAYRRKKRRKKHPITRKASQVALFKRAESSGSPKGKEREVRADTSCDEPNEITAAANESNELHLLRTKLEEQTTLLDAHKDFLTSLAPSITCQICLDPMYRPYALAPCGHTACYDCLLAWFRAPPPHIDLPPPQHLAFNFDAEVPTLLARDAPMLLRKEKTCPHCRAVVRDAPVEAWGIKDIVHHLFAHKGDVAKDLYPSYTRPQETNQLGSGQTGADAWAGVFKRGIVPRMLAVPNATRNGRAGAILDDDIEHGDHPRPFYDEEDAVFRCTECYHEIWGGICSSCGQLYPGHDFGEDEDEELDAGHWMDAEEFEGIEGHADLDDVYGGPDADIAIRGLMGALGFHRSHLFDADAEGYESSFIDDDEDDDRTRMEEYHSAEEAGDYDSENEEMAGNDEEDDVPRRVPPPRVDESAEEAPRLRLGTVELIDSDSDGPQQPANHRRARASHIRIDSDDEDASDAAQSERVIRAPGPSRARRPIVDDSDSEQDEDERSDLHVPSQRIYRTYAGSLSDEGSFSGDSDHSSQHDLHGSVSGLSHGNYENYAFSDEEVIVWSD